MGYAHGELLKEKAKNMMDDVWKYLEEQVVSSWLDSAAGFEIVFFLWWYQIEAINGTKSVFNFPGWFLEDVANMGSVFSPVALLRERAHCFIPV